MYAPSTDFCLLPGCDRPAYSRGICDACYLTALKMVRQGRTTWQELEERGLCNPPKGSRVLSNPLAETLRDKFACTTRGDRWKLNNNYTAHYARLVMNQEPDLAGFFETRQRKEAAR